MAGMSSESPKALPYKIACLCYLHDERGRLLLLHRSQEPNRGLYSPIGGKLHMDEGESPGACALREIHEEVELDLEPSDIRLRGLITETAFLNAGHWMMFLYEVTRPVVIERMEFNEGTLEWHDPKSVYDLKIPDTDRQVIFPLMEKYPDEFFHAHIDCVGERLDWHMQHPVVG
jgi:8-oxo-dGTP diphosphatase